MSRSSVWGEVSASLHILKPARQNSIPVVTPFNQFLVREITHVSKLLFTVYLHVFSFLFCSWFNTDVEDPKAKTILRILLLHIDKGIFIEPKPYFSSTVPLKYWMTTHLPHICTQNSPLNWNASSSVDPQIHYEWLQTLLHFWLSCCVIVVFAIFLVVFVDFKPVYELLFNHRAHKHTHTRTHAKENNNLTTQHIVLC